MAILIAIIGRSIDENEDGSALVALSGSVLARDIDETARMLFAEKPVVLTLGLAGEAVPADADAMAPATIAAQNEQIASMKKQLDESQAKLANEAWMHAACLSIAEGVKGWEDPIRPWQGVRDSAAMQAVRKLQADFIRARAQLVAKDEALAGVRESSLKKDEEIEFLRKRLLAYAPCIPDCGLGVGHAGFCIQRKEHPRDLAPPESLPEHHWACDRRPCVCDSLRALDAAAAQDKAVDPTGPACSNCCRGSHCDGAMSPCLCQCTGREKPSPIDAANSALAEMSDKIVAATEAPVKWIRDEGKETGRTECCGRGADEDGCCAGCGRDIDTVSLYGAAQEWPSPSSTTTGAPKHPGVAPGTIIVLGNPPSIHAPAVDAAIAIGKASARDNPPVYGRTLAPALGLTPEAYDYITQPAPASGRILAPKDPQCEGMNNSAGTRCTSEGYKAVSTALGEMHWFCGRHNPNKPPRKTKEKTDAAP